MLIRLAGLLKAASLFSLSVWLGLALGAEAAHAIVVYDLRIDFSNSSNPNGTWRYQKGNSLLAHFMPVSNATLALATANGYWGDTASSNNSAIMLTTAPGSATGLWSNADFLTGEVLVRTTDPLTGGPMNATWTAPSNGSFTYSGFFWYAGTPTGPGSNDYTLSLNAGPAMEAGTAGVGQDRTNVVGMVNGLTPVNVTTGDVLTLSMSPTTGFPFGSLAGVSLTIDFTPDAVSLIVPEPGTFVLGILGICLAYRSRRKSVLCC